MSFRHYHDPYDECAFYEDEDRYSGFERYELDYDDYEPLILVGIWGSPFDDDPDFWDTDYEEWLPHEHLVELYAHRLRTPPRTHDRDDWRGRARSRGKLATLRTHRDKRSMGGCREAIIRNYGRRWTTTLAAGPDYHRVVAQYLN